MGGGTMNLADLYGWPSAGTWRPDPNSVRGPNQGSVAPATEVASGIGQPSQGTGPAFAWVGFVLLLVAARLLIEVQDRSE